MSEPEIIFIDDDVEIKEDNKFKAGRPKGGKLSPEEKQKRIDHRKQYQKNYHNKDEVKKKKAESSNKYYKDLKDKAKKYDEIVNGKSS
jgi:hypothetical protein